MTDGGSGTAEDRKRVAEVSAKVVLAKHPHVVPGGIAPMRQAVEPSRHSTLDVGARNIGRGLQR